MDASIGIVAQASLRRVTAMSFQNSVFYVGCAVSWFVLLPMFAICGGLILFAYAVVAEVGALMAGGAQNSLDTSTAREIASRMCVG
jgi:hypothetical protein